jgi:hypothetical protein
MAMATACSRSQPAPPAQALEAGAAPPVVSASAAPSAAIAFMTFEGEIDATAKEAKSKDPPMDLALQIKNGKIRADIPEQLSHQGGSLFGQGYFIFDPTARKVAIVNDPRRQAFIFDLAKNPDVLKNLGGPPKPVGASQGAAHDLEDGALRHRRWLQMRGLGHHRGQARGHALRGR